jgi:hypothetical protein
LEDVDADWRITLKSMLKKQMGGCGVNSSGSGQELTGSCENGNELPVSIK